jgi:hypothetical protein
MLAIFRIPDTALIASLTQDQQLGSLSQSDLKALEPIFQQHPQVRLTYVDDTRLHAEQTAVFLAVCKAYHQTLQQQGNLGNVFYPRLIAMLEQAVARHEGIVAFCD